MSTTRNACVVLLLALSAGCAGSAAQGALGKDDLRAAITAFERDPRREPSDLRSIAEHVLVAEARSADTPDSARAWSLLGGMGRAAEGVWDALEREPGDHHVQLVRAHALRWRMKLGEAPARRELRALEEGARADAGATLEADVLAIAIEALDPERDVEALRAWTRSASATVRGAAVAQLEHAPASVESRFVLEELARSEADESVRVAAVHALAAQGIAAWPSVEALARDPSLRASDAVRAAALGTLAALDFARAEPLIAAELSTEPSMLGVEVAQDVLTRAQRGRRADSLELTADQQILAALAAPKPELRGRAASAALAVAGSADRAALRAELLVRLGAERDRRVHILLALALRGERASHDALLQLALGHDVPAAQAAAALAAQRDPSARARLDALAKSDDISVRATAATALASSYEFASMKIERPASVEALIDREPRVRATTAAALLRAIERLENQL